MGRGEDEAAGGEMRAHDESESALGGGVERSGRLVEQPDRPRRNQQARQCDAALLPGRQCVDREIGDMGETELVERRHPGGARKIAAERVSPESEVLASSQRPLQRVGMAEVMRLLADAGLRRAALKRNRSFGERQETGDRPQQARLARAVRADQQQRLAGPRGERHPRKDPAPAPFNGDFLGAQAHGIPSTAPPLCAPSDISLCSPAKGIYL